MYRIGVRHGFNAAHRLVGHPGKCSRLHGHSWMVEAVFSAQEPGVMGLVLDFEDARLALREAAAPFDHAYLNEVKPFDETPPTAENVARLLYEKVDERVRGESWPVELDSVTVWESGETWASFSRD